MTDNVNNPAHYKGKKWECIEIIDAFALDYYRGNALKYICRHKQKGGIEDLQKARWYLDHLAFNQELIMRLTWTPAPVELDPGKTMLAIDIADNFGITAPHVIDAIGYLRDTVFIAGAAAEIRVAIVAAAASLERYILEEPAAKSTGHG